MGVVRHVFELRRVGDKRLLRWILEEPTEADRQLEVWRETSSAVEVARDITERTRAATEGVKL